MARAVQRPARRRVHDGPKNRRRIPHHKRFDDDDWKLPGHATVTAASILGCRQGQQDPWRAVSLWSMHSRQRMRGDIVVWREFAKKLTWIVAVSSVVAALSASPAYADDDDPGASDSKCATVLGDQPSNNRVRLCLTVKWSVSPNMAPHVKVGTSAQFDGNVQTSATGCVIEYDSAFETVDGTYWGLPTKYSTGKTDCYGALRHGSYAYFTPLDTDTSASTVYSWVTIRFTYANGGSTSFGHYFHCLDFLAAHCTLRA